MQETHECPVAATAPADSPGNLEIETEEQVEAALCSLSLQACSSRGSDSAHALARKSEVLQKRGRRIGTPGLPRDRLSTRKEGGQENTKEGWPEDIIQDGWQSWRHNQ
ncbi:g11876 [Coccomyxa viridis]|uniref:G11876 protein n=1 Tax=Coccomyxa viridis TaxID=1274662 RepID=A0ABP1GEM2_9CHLO